MPHTAEHALQWKLGMSWIITSSQLQNLYLLSQEHLQALYAATGADSSIGSPVTVHHKCTLKTDSVTHGSVRTWPKSHEKTLQE